jgi:hypothetical protein
MDEERGASQKIHACMKRNYPRFYWRLARNRVRLKGGAGIDGRRSLGASGQDFLFRRFCERPGVDCRSRSVQELNSRNRNSN